MRRTVANPYTEVMVTVEPFGNCVCGLKEPETACADALLVVTQSPATVNVKSTSNLVIASCCLLNCIHSHLLLVLW